MHPLISQLKKKYKFRLVSNSPRRKKILQELGLNFSVINNPFKPKERIRDFFYFFDLVPETFKKFSGVKLAEGEALIACDTIVVYNFRVFGKPRNKAQAVSFLRKLSGKKHYVLSCIAVRAKVAGKIKNLYAVEKTAIYFRELSEVEIATYVATPEPYDKAGAYGIQGPARIFLRKICGCYDNVVGLPVSKFLKLLRKL